MRLRFTAVFLLFVILLLSCQQSAPAGTVSPNETTAAPRAATSVEKITETQSPVPLLPSPTPLPPSPSSSPSAQSATRTLALPPALPGGISAANIAQLTSLARTRQTSLGVVTAGAWSPSGKQLALGFDKSMLLLDTADWQVLWKAEARGKVTKLEFSPDGKLLAMGTPNQGGMVFEVSSGKSLYTTGIITAFSSDNKWLAHTNALYNAQTGELVRELEMPDFTQFDYEYPEMVAFSADGAYLLMGLSRGGFIAWDVASGKRFYRVVEELPTLECSSGPRNLAWAALFCYYPYDNFSKVDIQLRYVNLSKQPAVRLYAVKNIKVGDYGHYQLIPNQSYMGWAKNGEIQMLDAASNFYPADPLTGIPAFGGFAFSPVEKGRVLAVWNKDVLQIWDRMAKKILTQFGEEGIQNMTLLPGAVARAAISRTGGSLEIIDLAEGKELFKTWTHNNRGFALAVSPDGKNLVSGGSDMRVRLWDLVNLKSTPLKEKQAFSRVSGLTYHPKGNDLVLWYDSAYYYHFADRSLDKIDLNRTLLGQGSPILSIAYHPNADWMAVLAAVGFVEIRDTKGVLLRTIRLGRNPNSSRMMVSTDGAMLVMSGWGVYNLKNDQALLPFGGNIDSAALSPDQCLLAAGTRDGQIWLWDMENRLQLKPLSAHTSSVTDLAFSPDGRLLISASMDGSAVVWGLPGALSQSIPQRAEVRCPVPSLPLPTPLPTPTMTRTPTSTPKVTPTRTLTPKP